MLAVDRKWGGTLPWHKDCRHWLELGWGLSGRRQLERRAQHEADSLGRPATRAGHPHMEAAAARAVVVDPGEYPGEDPAVAVPVPRLGWHPAGTADRGACSEQPMSGGMQAERTAPGQAGRASQEWGWDRAWLSAMVHLCSLQGEPAGAVAREAVAAAAVEEDAREVCKAAVLQAVPRMQLQADWDAEGSDAAAAAEDARVVAAVADVVAAAVVAAADGAYAEWPQLNPG